MSNDSQKSRQNWHVWINEASFVPLNLSHQISNSLSLRCLIIQEYFINLSVYIELFLNKLRTVDFTYSGHQIRLCLFDLLIWPCVEFMEFLHNALIVAVIHDEGVKVRLNEIFIVV